jgi:hypothetical protein
VKCKRCQFRRSENFGPDLIGVSGTRKEDHEEENMTESVPTCPAEDPVHISMVAGRGVDEPGEDLSEP